MSSRVETLAQRDGECLLETTTTRLKWRPQNYCENRDDRAVLWGGRGQAGGENTLTVNDWRLWECIQAGRILSWPSRSRGIDDGALCPHSCVVAAQRHSRMRPRWCSSRRDTGGCRPEGNLGRSARSVGKREADEESQPEGTTTTTQMWAASAAISAAHNPSYQNGNPIGIMDPQWRNKQMTEGKHWRQLDITNLFTSTAKIIHKGRDFIR